TNIANLSKHTTRYISPVLTQKVFANMRRVGKEPDAEEVATNVIPPTPTSPSPSSHVIPSSPPYQSPWVKTPLFETMLAVRDIAEEAEAQIPAQDDDVQEHAEEEIATDVVPPTPTSPSPSSHVLDTCSALVLRVEGLETANSAQQLEIVKLKANVKKLEKLNKGRISVDMETDEGVELVVDHEKNAEVEGRQADKQAEIYNIDLDHSLKVVAASTPISAAKPKVLKIAAAPAVSIRKRK
nr:hypothetical protein [Tanacetum cinerariifolium]